MFSFLWEMEMGTVYQMTKANDIFSGLGSEGLPAAPATAANTEQQAQQEALEKLLCGEEEDTEGDSNNDNSSPKNSARRSSSSKAPNLTPIPEDRDETTERSRNVTPVESLPTDDNSAASASASAGVDVDDIAVRLDEQAHIASPTPVTAADPAAAERERKELAKAIQRAECIVETWENVKVGLRCTVLLMPDALLQ
jgi:ribosomal protein L12E/L44/L45/RPP1/RPP2